MVGQTSSFCSPQVVVDSGHFIGRLLTDLPFVALLVAAESSSAMNKSLFAPSVASLQKNASAEDLFSDIIRTPR